MSGPAPRVDREAARATGTELARVTYIQRTRPADVAHVRLPLALQVLDECGGDPVMAICLMASLVNPDTIPPPLPADPAPRGRALQLVPASPDIRRTTP